MENILKLNKKRIEEVKGFLENYGEEVEEIISEGYDIEEEAEELYNSDMNFNNCDPTTQMRCLEQDEIVEYLEDSIEYLKLSEDRCSYCANILQDDDWITDTQNHPYGETYATENICIGYQCNKCGEEENF